jgi:hypothetical protein
VIAAIEAVGGSQIAELAEVIVPAVGFAGELVVGFGGGVWLIF